MKIIIKDYKSIILLYIFIFFVNSKTYSSQKFNEKPTTIPEVINYSAYNSLLSLIVIEGRIDYKKLYQLKDLLQSSVNSMTKITKKSLSALPKRDQLAFWLNLYNLTLLNTFVKRYPITSFLDLQTDFMTPWEVASIEIFGQKYSLDKILHNHIIAEFNDPRIHCILSYGAISSPRQYPYAFRGENLTQKLHDACIEFVNDPKKNIINRRHLILSPIFKRYSKDFSLYYSQKSPLFRSRDNIDKAILNFIYLHASRDKQELLKEDKYDITYGKFNWQLNDVTRLESK